jgi:hypothetical protein
MCNYFSAFFIPPLEKKFEIRNSKQYRMTKIQNYTFAKLAKKFD